MLCRFDKYCHFGNEVDMNKASLRHLQQQVRSYKPEIPYYVCRISKTTTQLSRGKMVPLNLTHIKISKVENNQLRSLNF
jgi:S-adenosylhomocysteine hydrolase